MENPTDEMIDALEPSQPQEEGFHITKLSARDSERLLAVLQNPPPGEELKKRVQPRRECGSFAHERFDLLR